MKIFITLAMMAETFTIQERAVSSMEESLVSGYINPQLLN
jgi:hypothetical protein|tara:strand:- start:523 stop:642 length:120 start_codon:yes stop_codon:yes gene_type:complete